MSSRKRSRRTSWLRNNRSFHLILESLEDRLVLSAVLPGFREYHSPGTYPSGLTPSPVGILPQDNGSQSPVGYLPDQIRTAYGIDNILFGKVQGDGTGQTIAIVDAYDDPSFVDSAVNGSPNPSFGSSDLAQFDLATGLTIRQALPSTTNRGRRRIFQAPTRGPGQS